MAWRNVDEATQIYAMDEVVIFIAYNVSALCAVPQIKPQALRIVLVVCS